MKKFIFAFLFLTILTPKALAAQEGFYPFPDASNLNCSLEGNVITSYFKNAEERVDKVVAGLAVYAIESPYVSPIPFKKNSNYGTPALTDANGDYRLTGLDCNKPVFIQFTANKPLKVLLIEWGKIAGGKAKYNLRLGENINTSSISYNSRMAPDDSEFSCKLNDENVDQFPVEWPVGKPQIIEQLAITGTCLSEPLKCFVAGIKVIFDGEYYKYILGGADKFLYTTNLSTDRRWRRDPFVMGFGWSPDVPEKELPKCEDIKAMNDKSYEKPWLLGKGGAYFIKGAIPGAIEKLAEEARTRIGDISVCKDGSNIIKFNEIAIPGLEETGKRKDESFFPYYMLLAQKDSQTKAETIPSVGGESINTTCSGFGCKPGEDPTNDSKSKQPALLGGGVTKSPKVAENVAEGFNMFQRPGFNETGEEPQPADSGISELVTPGKECSCPEEKRISDSKAPGGYRCSEGGVTFDILVKLQKDFITELCKNSTSGFCQQYNKQITADADIKTKLPNVENIGFYGNSLGNALARPGAERQAVGSLGSVRGSMKGTNDDTFFKSELGGGTEDAAGFYTDAFRIPGAEK